MTIPTTTRSVTYPSTGVAATFPFTYYVFLSSHLQVTVTSTANAISTLVLSTDGISGDYTVTGTLSTSGGSISLLNNGQTWMGSGVLKSGYSITIARVVPLTQITNVRGEGRYNPEIHENEYDLLCMADQQMQGQITQLQSTVNLLGFLNFPVLTTAPIVPTTGCNVYAISSGGKAQLLIQFPTGAAKILSQET